MKISRAQFYLGFLLYLFVMFDLFYTSVGIDRGIGELNPILNIYIQNTGNEIADGLILVFGGLIATGLMLALCFVISKLVKVFSMEFFLTILILMHFMGILNWLAIL
ncbi:MAG: hypothetical protein MUP55_02840 [Candidatus Aenigmarchaeota archaeon]|nr:hypothetical protein [Candidatus Aenigmarchaeota archaeon]